VALKLTGTIGVSLLFLLSTVSFVPDFRFFLASLHLKWFFFTGDENNSRYPGYLLIGDRYMCMLCQHTFNTLPILSRHIAAKHQKQDSVFFCDKCNRYFKTKWSLSTHNSRYHKSPAFPEQIGHDGNNP
jgi:hypothetical protein